MWVNKILFNTLLADNKATADRLAAVWNTCHILQTKHDDALAQKAKDDMTIDWMRHRVNELSKHNAVLLAKATGINVPVPEIVPTRPGTLTLPPDFPTMPSFEDVGDEEARRLGIGHDEAGVVEYAK